MPAEGTHGWLTYGGSMGKGAHIVCRVGGYQFYTYYLLRSSIIRLPALFSPSLFIDCFAPSVHVYVRLTRAQLDKTCPWKTVSSSRAVTDS